jgi:hypothetical protein
MDHLHEDLNRIRERLPYEEFKEHQVRIAHVCWR